jgi:hypothetical protein
MTAHVCGIDIGKTVFHLIGLSKEGQIVAEKRFTRKQLITHTVIQARFGERALQRFQDSPHASVASQLVIPVLRRTGHPFAV